MCRSCSVVAACVSAGAQGISALQSCNWLHEDQSVGTTSIRQRANVVHLSCSSVAAWNTQAIAARNTHLCALNSFMISRNWSYTSFLSMKRILTCAHERGHVGVKGSVRWQRMETRDTCCQAHDALTTRYFRARIDAFAGWRASAGGECVG